MSATTLATPRRRTLPGPRGLVWTVLRLHRTALWIWLAFVTGTAGLLLWLYGPGATAAQQAFDTYGYYVPGGLNSTKEAYDDLFYRPATLISVATFVVPLFAGGALIGRELETGTAQLAWTQSVSPARWLAARLAVPALLIATGTGLLVALYRLLWSAHNGLLVAGYAPVSSTSPSARRPSCTPCSAWPSARSSACWCAARCRRSRSPPAPSTCSPHSTTGSGPSSTTRPTARPRNSPCTAARSPRAAP
ncbi:hypothetical protein SAVCW2_39440 [Streptomyces avermitilis]|uniref:hypothetical protein n=1 Tax=Streptomyces avermitilis TaxID=33903 RepID=UPI0010F314CF|nr:hypothetical protein [Streptomyces avermitilis]GDY84745.1 hypothetical protein SAVCW2_39440 [Streptomyces avermitilis]